MLAYLVLYVNLIYVKRGNIEIRVSIVLDLHGLMCSQNQVSMMNMDLQRTPERCDVACARKMLLMQNMEHSLGNTVVIQIVKPGFFLSSVLYERI